MMIGIAGMNTFTTLSKKEIPMRILIASILLLFTVGLASANHQQMRVIPMLVCDEESVAKNAVDVMFEADREVSAELIASLILKTQCRMLRVGVLARGSTDHLSYFKEEGNRVLGVMPLRLNDGTPKYGIVEAITEEPTIPKPAKGIAI